MRDKNYLKEADKAVFEAVWQWVKDHSDLLPDGQLFLKAHISDKNKFQRSIRFRMKGAYRNVLDTDMEMVNRRDKVLKAQIKKNLEKVGEDNIKNLKNKTMFDRFKMYFKKNI